MVVAVQNFVPGLLQGIKTLLVTVAASPFRMDKYSLDDLHCFVERCNGNPFWEPFNIIEQVQQYVVVLVGQR